MSYDPLDRLVQTTSNMFGTASYGYDVLDNLNTVQVSGGSQARNHTYAYDPATRRLSQVKNTVGGAVVANLTYDAQGNLASKGSQAYQFDLGNRLRSVPGQETGYEYDGHGRRVFAQTVGSGQVLSQYGNDGKLLYQNDARHGRRTDYVYLGSRLVAYRERPLSSSTATVKYQHVDALGTPVAVTNAAKTTIETGEYEPYGRLVNKPLFDGPGYTGHVQDAATGLTYMQQRYYDPLLGVFLSVDPVTAYSNPVSMFNRYRYASSNPFLFVDPDGRQARPGGSEQYHEDYIPPLPTPSSEQPIVDLEPIQVKGEIKALPVSASTDAKVFLLAYGYGTEQSMQIRTDLLSGGGWSQSSVCITTSRCHYFGLGAYIGSNVLGGTLDVGDIGAEGVYVGLTLDAGAFGGGVGGDINVNREGLGIGAGVGASKGAIGAAKLCFVRERSGGCE